MTEWFLLGGGEMGQRMRAFDCGRSPLGFRDAGRAASGRRELALAPEPGGEVLLDLRPEGLVCTIEAPLAGTRA